MIPLSLIPVALGGIQSLFGAFNSLKNKRPEYKLPPAVQQGLSLAEAQAASDMPNYGQGKSDIQTSTGNAITAARESGNPLAAISQIQANENKGVNDLNVQNAGYKDGKQNQLRQALDHYADYQDEQFQLNAYAPYKEKRQLYNNMFGSGISNIVGGIDSNNLQKTMGANTDSNNGILQQLLKMQGQGGGGQSGYVTPQLPSLQMHTSLGQSTWQTPYLPFKKG